MSPNLLLYPVSDKRKAFTRIADSKVVHPTTKDRVDLFDHPFHGLADILSEDLLQLCRYVSKKPEIQNEGDDGPINLVMRLDQGKPYRVGKVEFLGLNEIMQNELTPRLKPGDVFNRNLVDEIIKRNRPLLPPDASWDDVSVQRNTKDGTVDILFDFRVRFDFWTCSMPED
jgi:hypothetical protein